MALALSACGGGQRLDANEPGGNFTVSVPTASFPVSQTLSEHTHLVLVIRNASNTAIPNLAVTICNVTCAYPAPPGEGSSAAPFATGNPQEYISNPSKPVWVIDQPPGPCSGVHGYSCASGGAGAYTTLAANTWALGSALQPGHSATFRWAVTAVAPGHHVVAWQVAAGLSGKAKAVLADGSQPQGTFPVNIGTAPAQSYVTDSGQIVTTK